MAEIDLTPLHDGPLYPFREFRQVDVPRNIAGLYTVWDGTGRFIYVGIGGTQVRYQEPDDESEPSKVVEGLRGRLNQHYMGDRGSDRFCLAVFDVLVLPTLTPDQRRIDPPSAKPMNDVTASYIREHLAFRWMELRVPAKELGIVERSIKRGEWPKGKPYLNGS